MISSMTGFGKGIHQVNDIIAEVEIKSLNSRFLDLSVRFPKSQSHNELKFRDIIKKHIKRGKVTVNIFIKKEGCGDKFLEIDNEGLNTALNLINSLKEKTGVKGELTFNDVVQFQNLYFTDSFADPDKEFEIIQVALENALEQLKEMRINEGSSLVNDLRERLNIIEEKLDKIKIQITPSIEDYYNKLKDRAMLLLEDSDKYDDRLRLELALIAEKYDVMEEIVRLGSHISVFNNTLNDEVEVGKKLNFLCQEMNREANTINSKSVSTDISYLALEIKEELERIREQIQNIE